MKLKIFLVFLIMANFKSKGIEISENKYIFKNEKQNFNKQKLKNYKEPNRIFIDANLSFILPFDWKVSDNNSLEKFKAYSKEKTGQSSSLKMVLIKKSSINIDYPFISIGFVPYNSNSKNLTFPNFKKYIKNSYPTLFKNGKELYTEFIAEISTNEILVNDKQEWIMIKNIVEIPTAGGKLMNYLVLVHSLKGIYRFNLTFLPQDKDASFAALKIIVNNLQKIP
jgi:regulatory protein YycI of two-component signal transduction system YycFG